MEIKERLFVSFSGGKTSAFMCKWVKDNLPDKDIIFVFANTGQEHPETYNFIYKCNQYFKLHLKIVEARITEKGTKHTLVDFDKMCRTGQLFTNMVKKYGIPNTSFPHCTRELKLRPMKSYVDGVFGVNNYTTVIGIRADEIDRLDPKFEEKSYYYPLAFNGITKDDINKFWETMPFNLEIPEHLGNCVWCWKKSFKKHNLIIRDIPEAYKVPKYLEKRFAINKIESQANRYGKTQTFFRTGLSARDLFENYKKEGLEKEMALDETQGYNNSCKESCEPF